MRFSVVIPSYNQSIYLRECIESVLNQTYKSYYEVIVVDDGSTDDSLQIAKSYPVKVISQVNKGLSSARNTGIMNSTGEYIIFLDSDDVMLPTYIERINEQIKEDAFDVISPSFVCFGKHNAEVVLMENPSIQDFITGNRVGYCSAIKRSVLLEVGGYSPRMTWGYEDYHLWFNLFSRGKRIKTLKDILWKYRTKESSMITTAQQHHEELMNQINKDFKLW